MENKKTFVFYINEGYENVLYPNNVKLNISI